MYLDLFRDVLPDLHTGSAILRDLMQYTLGECGGPQIGGQYGAAIQDAAYLSRESAGQGSRPSAELGSFLDKYSSLMCQYDNSEETLLPVRWLHRVSSCSITDQGARECDRREGSRAEIWKPFTCTHLSEFRHHHDHSYTSPLIHRP